jgi:FkbM family methyltransferase
MFDIARYKREAIVWGKSGKEKLRYEYNIKNSKGIIFDVGGFNGDWTSKMSSLYKGTYHIFEIFPEYVDKLRKRFSSSDIIINDCALGAYNGQEDVSINEDSTDDISMYNKDTNSTITVNRVKFEDYLIKHDINFIDVLKVNIEGGEYEFMEGIEDYSNIDNIQVQFHYQFNIENFHERRQQIRNRLEKTHRLVFDYYYVWEHWVLK